MAWNDYNFRNSALDDAFLEEWKAAGGRGVIGRREECDCVVTEVRYPKPDMADPSYERCILKVTRLGDNHSFTLKGPFGVVPYPGARFTATGTWNTQSYNGREWPVFAMDSCKILPVEDLKDIESYLSSGLIRGIGPVLASNIVKKFGKDTFHILDENTKIVNEAKARREQEKEEQEDEEKEEASTKKKKKKEAPLSRGSPLLKVDIIGEERAVRIAQAWEEQSSIRDIMLFLKSHDIPNGLATKIFRQYGPDSVKTLTENPYRLADDLDGVSFLTADKLSLSIAPDSFWKSEDRIRAAINHILKETANTKGDTYSTKEYVANECWRLLNNSIVEWTTQNFRRHGTVTAGNEDKEVTYDQILNVLKEESEHIVFSGPNDARVYSRRLYDNEQFIAQRLTELLTAPSKKKGAEPDFEKLEAACGGDSFHFDESQKEAVRLACSSNVCVITGGPGTGKTTTMKGVVEAAVLDGTKKLLFAAPTGKAAQRLSEATGREAKTIHRLLGFGPKGFAFNEKNPLSTTSGLLVIDESSMIDLSLMTHLLKAIPASKKPLRIVFVGDVDQLPSVGTGTVFRDLIESGKIPVARLSSIHRQKEGSYIITNAHAINKATYNNKPELTMPDTLTGDFSFIDVQEKDHNGKVVQGVVHNKVIGIVDELLRKKVAPNDIQVLCPSRGSSAGVTGMNASLQPMLNNPAAKVVATKNIGNTKVEFRVGDRVMQTRNNYTWNVFNGDVGTITGTTKDPDGKTLIKISFADTNIQARPQDFGDIDLCYGTTIHKSQGSEYPYVVIPVSNSDQFQLNKNLLYTAVTRAKKHCILVGDRELFLKSICKPGTRRNSALAEAIEAGTNEEILRNLWEKETVKAKFCRLYDDSIYVGPTSGSPFVVDGVSEDNNGERTVVKNGRYNVADSHGSLKMREWSSQPLGVSIATGKAVSASPAPAPAYNPVELVKRQLDAAVQSGKILGAGDFHDGWFLVKTKSGKYNFMDVQKNLITQNPFDAATEFRNGKAVVEREGKSITINAAGRILNIKDLNNGMKGPN